MTGVSELIVGFIFVATGWHEWYWNTFKFFGVLGIGMILYAYWHQYFLIREAKNDVDRTTFN